VRLVRNRNLDLGRMPRPAVSEPPNKTLRKQTSPQRRVLEACLTGHLNARLSFVFVAPWQSFKGIVYVQKLNYLAAVVATKSSMPKVCFGHLSIAYRTARVHRRGIAAEGVPRSSKLSEVAPQHDAKAGQIVVLGELSPIAGAALLFLSRLSPQQSSASALVFR
jgi:hypothetical protein